RRGRWLFALGIVGMLGFVASFVAALNGTFSTGPYLLSVGLSFGAYLASVTMSFFEDRRVRAQRTRARTPVITLPDRLAVLSRRVRTARSAPVFGGNVVSFGRTRRRARAR